MDVHWGRQVGDMEHTLKIPFKPFKLARQDVWKIGLACLPVTKNMQT
jgi:hypothetical protein